MIRILTFASGSLVGVAFTLIFQAVWENLRILDPPVVPKYDWINLKVRIGLILILAACFLTS